MFYWGASCDRRNLLEHWQGWRSLDLHPREQIWVKLEDKLGRSVVHSKEILWAELQKTWENINVEVQTDEMLSCRKSMNQIIKVDINVCIFKVTAHMTIYTFMWFIWVCYFRFALYHNRYELSLCLLQVTDVTDVCLRWSNEMSGGWFGSITAEI